MHFKYQDEELFFIIVMMAQHENLSFFINHSMAASAIIKLHSCPSHHTYWKSEYLVQSSTKVSFSVSRNPAGGLIIALKSFEMKLNALWGQIWTPVSPEQGTNPPCFLLFQISVSIHRSPVKFIYPGSIQGDHEKCAVEVNKEFIKD